MLDGVYTVEARTPLGVRRGTIIMVTEGDVCLTELTVGGKTKQLVGTIEGETVTFEGSVSLPFPFGKLPFTLVGGVVGDELSGTCSAKKFSFDVSGSRIA